MVTVELIVPFTLIHAQVINPYSKELKFLILNSLNFIQEVNVTSNQICVARDGYADFFACLVILKMEQDVRVRIKTKYIMI